MHCNAHCFIELQNCVGLPLAHSSHFVILHCVLLLVLCWRDGLTVKSIFRNWNMIQSQNVVTCISRGICRNYDMIQIPKCGNMATPCMHVTALSEAVQQDCEFLKTKQIWRQNKRVDCEYACISKIICDIIWQCHSCCSQQCNNLTLCEKYHQIRVKSEALQKYYFSTFFQIHDRL